MENKDIPIIKTNYGVSSNYGSFIEINRKLDYYPVLKKKIMLHELRHTKGTYGVTDLKNDFQSKDSTFFQVLMFSAKNKEALINFFPFMYSYYAKEWSYNPSSFPPFIVLGIIFVLFFKLILGLPILHLILGWISVITILNLILLAYTHYYVKKQEKVKLPEKQYKIY